MLRIEPAAAVGTRDHFQDMAVRVVEIHAAAIVPVIDALRITVERIGPERDLAGSDSRQDFVEFRLRDEECEMPWRDRLFGLDEIEGGLADLDDGEVAEWRCASSPSVSVRKRAVCFASCACTRMWFNVTAIAPNLSFRCAGSMSPSLLLGGAQIGPARSDVKCRPW